MTREEIIAQFQGNSEIEPTVYVFNGPLIDLQEVADTSVRTLSVNGVLYFMSMDRNYTPTDVRMETL